MKKNIVIIILALTTATSMTYALVQQTAAKRAMKEARESAVLSKQNEEIATNCQRNAERLQQSMKLASETAEQAVVEMRKTLQTQIDRSKKNK